MKIAIGHIDLNHYLVCVCVWDCFYNHQQPCPMCSSHAGTSTSTSDMHLSTPPVLDHLQKLHARAKKSKLKKQKRETEKKIAVAA